MSTARRPLCREFMICPLSRASDLSAFAAGWSTRCRRGGVMEYSSAAWERAMRMQDVILRAMSGEISWFAAADILEMTPRNLRRWRERYERWGYNGLVDKRRCPSKRRVP